MASVLAEFDQEEYEEMIRRESKEDGFREGLSQGIEQGIFIFIKDKLEDGIPNERIIEKLIKNYNLDEQTAQKYISELQDQLAQ